MILSFEVGDKTVVLDVDYDNKWFAFCDTMGVVMKRLGIAPGTGLWVAKGDCSWKWHEEIPF